jgi:hypothetical protein
LLCTRYVPFHGIKKQKSSDEKKKKKEILSTKIMASHQTFYAYLTTPGKY